MSKHLKTLFDALIRILMIKLRGYTLSEKNQIYHRGTRERVIFPIVPKRIDGRLYWLQFVRVSEVFFEVFQTKETAKKHPDLRSGWEIHKVVQD